jgi:hypothetical protein
MPCRKVLGLLTYPELHHALKQSKKWRIFRTVHNQNRPFLPLLDRYLCCDELSCLMSRPRLNDSLTKHMKSNMLRT